MKTSILLLILCCPFILISQADIFGIWKAIDDKDGQATSHIEVYERQGKLHGRVVKLLKENENVRCTSCHGDKKNQPIIGMEIIWGMEKKGDDWKGGRILDPGAGKNYKCRMTLANDILEVRGYVGVPALGRTQKWQRVL